MAAREEAEVPPARPTVQPTSQNSSGVAKFHHLSQHWSPFIKLILCCMTTKLMKWKYAEKHGGEKSSRPKVRNPNSKLSVYYQQSFSLPAQCLNHWDEIKTWLQLQWLLSEQTLISHSHSHVSCSSSPPPLNFATFHFVVRPAPVLTQEASSAESHALRSFIKAT